MKNTSFTPEKDSFFKNHSTTSFNTPCKSVKSENRNESQAAI